MAGCVSALFVILCVVAARLSGFVIALPGAFMTLRYAGAADLFYLGVMAWYSKGPSQSALLDLMFEGDNQDVRRLPSPPDRSGRAQAVTIGRSFAQHSRQHRGARQRGELTVQADSPVTPQSGR